MTTITLANNFTGDWSEYIDHGDSLTVDTASATSVTLAISSSEDDDELAGLDGGHLILSGSGFVVDGSTPPNISGGTLSQIEVLNDVGASLFSIADPGLNYDDFLALANAGNLDKWLEVESDDFGDDHGSDHGDSVTEAENEDADDHPGDDPDGYYEDNAAHNDHITGGSGDDDYFGGG